MSYLAIDQADLVLAPSDSGQSAILQVPLGAAALTDLNGSWGSPASANRFKNGDASSTGVGGSVYFSLINDGTATAYIRFRARTSASGGTTAGNGVPISSGGRMDLWVPYSLSMLDVFGTNGILKVWASSRAG